MSSTAKILVVEDDHLVAMEIEDALAGAGYEVAGIATSAEEAVEMARASRPALAVMDIRLVGARDGVDAALDLFRSLGLRCIFATAHQDARMRARAAPTQPFGWLGKPYSMQALVAAVETALSELRTGS